MNPDSSNDARLLVQSLLDDATDVDTFDAAMQQLAASPEAMLSLRDIQCLRDALHGNACPDRRYTEGIMRYIAAAEAKRLAGD